MSGCLSAKHIVAVNTDAETPIIAHADYAVIGDLNEVIPALVTAIRARNSLGGECLPRAAPLAGPAS